MPTLWAPSFWRLALASDAIGMWDLAAALTHMDVCHRVGEEAKARKLPYYLGVVYDEVLSL